MLWLILNKSWRQHPSKKQLYSHLPPITKNIQVRRTRHVGHCWRSGDGHISDILQWTPSHGRPARYNSSLSIQNIALKTYRERWTIETGDGRRSERCVQASRHDNDEDDIPVVHKSHTHTHTHTHIYIYIYVRIIKFTSKFAF